MSSTPGSSDPERRRDHLRRTIRRITTTFRRADGHTNDFDADIPGSVSPASLASLALPALPVESGPSSMDAFTAGPSRLHDEPLIVDSDDALFPARPSQVHNAPLIAASDSGDALLAASDDHPQSLDPRFATRGNFITGEWTLDRASAHNDRAQRLMAKYGVDIQPADRASANVPSVVHRVQRAPRMRIQRACHECGANFSQHKKCKACGHDICRRCPRAAGRRPESVMTQEGVQPQATEGSQVVEAGPSNSTENFQTLTSDPISRSVDADSMQIEEEKAVATADSMQLNHQSERAYSQSLEDENQGPGERRWKGKGRLVEPDSRMDLHPESSALSTAEEPNSTSFEHFSRRNMPPRFTFDRSPTSQAEPLCDISTTIEVDDVTQQSASQPQTLRMDAERQLLVDMATQARNKNSALPASIEASGSGSGFTNLGSSLQPDDLMTQLPPSSLVRHARSKSSIHYLSSLAAAGPTGTDRDSLSPPLCNANPRL